VFASFPVLSVSNQADCGSAFNPRDESKRNPEPALFTNTNLSAQVAVELASQVATLFDAPSFRREFKTLKDRSFLFRNVLTHPRSCHSFLERWLVDNEREQRRTFGPDTHGGGVFSR
jgi:hypothetical protein